MGSNEIVEIYADSISAESIVRGKITGISTKRNEIDIEIMTTDLSNYAYGDDILIRVTKDANIYIGNTQIDLDELVRNDIVTIYGYYDGRDFTASEISIR